jgi:hypothetical protein
MQLEIFYSWLKENNLLDKIPNPIDFKIQQLKDNMQKELSKINSAKSSLQSYFDMDEYEFGRQQYSVKSVIQTLTKAYEDYILKKDSLEKDIKDLKENHNHHDLNFLLDIQELDFSNSKITTLPKEIIELKSLKKLNISNTNIEKIDTKIANGSFSLNIKGTSLEINNDLIENIKSSQYSTINIEFDKNTKISNDCKELSFVKNGIEEFIKHEINLIEKIKLANAYGITKLTLDPNDINDKFFEQDFSKIEFINLMSDTVDEDVANKLFELSSKTNINIAFAYDTTVGNLEQKMLKEASNPEELKEYPDDVWNGINWEDKNLDLTVVSYNDFDSYYDTNEDIMKAIYNNAFSLKASGEKVIVMESDDYDFKVMSLDCTDHLGQEQWEYYSTDTNDGVLERYINYCSAELTDIGIEDILSFKLGNISAEELVDDYGLDYDCEQEGYYGD